MYIVFEIQDPNPFNMPSPFMETNSRPQEEIKDITQIMLSFFKDKNLEVEVKSGTDLRLLTSQPHIKLDVFKQIYGV